MSCRRAVCLAVLASLSLQGALVSPSRGDTPTAASVKEAGKHFQRGVSLYTEADYRAALVEFRRAHEIAPNATVLYNIGQTYYQLQNYAAALTTLQRYLAEAGSGAAHRREVEQTIDTLQARVGRVTITTNAADCEITIDDEPIGKSPLAEPALVSIGRRKVTATRAGVPPQTRFVDVAAGDTVELTFSLGDAGTSGQLPSSPDQPAGPRRSRGVTVGWIATGVLGAGAVTTGVLAYLASRDLKKERDKFPASHDELSSKSSTVKNYAIAADVLTVLALATGGITFYVSRSSSHEVHVAVVPNGLQLAGTFR